MTSPASESWKGNALKIAQGILHASQGQILNLHAALTGEEEIRKLKCGIKVNGQWGGVLL